MTPTVFTLNTKAFSLFIVLVLKFEHVHFSTVNVLKF